MMVLKEEAGPGGEKDEPRQHRHRQPELGGGGVGDGVAHEGIGRHMGEKAAHRPQQIGQSFTAPMYMEMRSQENSPTMRVRKAKRKSPPRRKERMASTLGCFSTSRSRAPAPERREIQ